MKICSVTLRAKDRPLLVCLWHHALIFHFVAGGLRLVRGDHRFNVARHVTKIDRPVFLKSSRLFEVGGQLADQFAILSSMSSFSSLALSSFIG
jgi:hypothetical protein